ncbi:hypothetical protein [Pseudonocardia sp. GCM10023141]|uniref:hypothetical protein n=1 Tax=Pseudonocardia sp. GCM10023141 TaxID=3252653 RepID=UPI0036139226
MNNDALVAALGMDAVAAVGGYRAQVMGEAGRRGLRLADDALPGLDPLDIRLSFRHCAGRGDLAGRTLRWSSAHGWSLSHLTANGTMSYYAGPQAGPLLLVPSASEVVDWALGACDGPATPPVGVDLDDDPRAIRRLIGCLSHRAELHAPALDRKSG